jgi:hypothetical protein
MTALRPVLVALVLAVGLPAAMPAATSLVREGPPAPAVLFEHFPSRLHAYVWRNWELVDTPLLARTIGATPAQLEALAASMGLGANRAPARAVQRQIYITIVRRNWHLLPLGQLLALIGMTAEEFEFRLKEDDALGLKLGSAKPACAPVRYAAPDAAANARAAEIKATMNQYFGRALGERGEMPLAFAAAWNQPPPATLPDAPTAAPARKPRFVFSYLGSYGDPLAEPNAIDPYPDGLLARLAAMGVNGVWLHVVLRDLAPGGEDFPEFGLGHERRLESLRHLVTKAQRHGIEVYLYMNEPRAMPSAFFASRPELAGVRGWAGFDLVSLCTSTPAVRRWMGDALAHVFRAVPGLGGVFTITASENPTNCASHFRQAECPRCRDRSPAEIIAEVNATIAAGVHRGNPAARVIAWDWGWAHHGEATDYIRRLPDDVWFMSVSEWAQPFERGGVKGKVGEYSLSVVGPGPRALAHWEAARARGLPTVAKVQLNNTWELSTVPYLPVMDLVAEHCLNLARAGVDGLMLSWSLGGYPSPNFQLAQWLMDGKYTDSAAALDALATARYGRAATADARRAWTAFSRGFQEFPYGLGLYVAPLQTGPANLLFRATPGYPATMTCYPFDELKRWRGIYPVDTFISQFERMAAGWETGIIALRRARDAAGPAQRAAADEDLGIAEAATTTFASVAQQARFIVARETLARTPDDAAARTAARAALTAEIALAQRLYPLARRDSRLGFEAANHYFYVPLDLAEKVMSCAFLLRPDTNFGSP